MWIRDATNQVWPYLRIARDDAATFRFILGVANRQMKSLRLDPYANAFKFSPSQPGEWTSDKVKPAPSELVWESKYELDSLAAYFKLVNG